MLIFRFEKKNQPDCQDGIEGSIKESRLLNRFAKDECAGKVALECRDERWRRMYTEDIQSFLDQYRRDGKAWPAA